MGSKKKNASTKFILRPGLNIGELVAEDDLEFLNKAFIDVPILIEIADHAQSRSIILGRTGAGKTALLTRIKNTKQNVYEVKPDEVSLNYISNSTVIKFFSDIGVDLDVFYQLLWRHVIAVELIRQRYDISSETQNRSILQRLQEAIFGDERKKAAIDYLRKWQSKFWINWDERIKEITDNFEGELNAAVKTALGSNVTVELGGATKLESKEKLELVSRGQAIVNAVQISELTRVIDMLADQAFNDRHQFYYLVIDDLDRKWVDEKIQFKLIRALIETVRVFRRIKNLKIVVALRADILERVYSETRDLGSQLDKFDGYIANLRWTEKELKELVNKRIHELFKNKYTKANVVFESIFRNKVMDVDPFKYIVERTLMRPRDIIAFINLCLRSAEGKSEVTAQTIRNAEQEYSNKRLIAIQDEWQSVHPNLSIGIELLSNKPEIFTFAEVCARDIVENIALKLTESSERSSDSIIIAARAVFDSETIPNILRFARLLTSILYKTGLVGLKTEAYHTFNYCYINSPTIAEHQIGENCKIRIHPMFWRALGTRL